MKYLLMLCVVMVAGCSADGSGDSIGKAIYDERLRAAEERTFAWERRCQWFEKKMGESYNKGLAFAHGIENDVQIYNTDGQFYYLSLRKGRLIVTPPTYYPIERPPSAF